MHLTKATCLDN